MKKLKKIIIKCTIAVILLLCANLVYYVFAGQERSAEKLAQGKKLNFYECVSIYQMHNAVWMFGWPLSPEAAQQAFIMAFPHKSSIMKDNDFFTKSKMLYQFPIENKQNDRRTLNYPINRITSTGDRSELRYALALTGGYYQFVKDAEVPFECCTVQAKYDKYVGIYKIGPIKLKLNWALLNYLQEIGWLTPFQITYFAD